jgi:hypothetical protein
MIKLTFMIGRETLRFSIRDKEIFYQDRIWKDAIRCIPKDEKFIEKIRNSRNKYSPKLIEMFSLSEKQQEEYNKATTETELAEIIIHDCQKKAIKLIKKETE